MTLEYLGCGKDSLKGIIPIEDDKPHIKVARRALRNVERVTEAVNPLSDFFMMWSRSAGRSHESGYCM